MGIEIPKANFRKLINKLLVNMKTLQKTILVVFMSIALVLTNYAVFAEVDVPVSTTKEDGNKVVTGVTVNKSPKASSSPLTGGWIESKKEDSSRKLNVNKDGTVSISAQQGQYSGSVKHSPDTGNSLKLGVGSEHDKLSGSFSHSLDTGHSSYGVGVGHDKYSGSVTHSPSTGDSSLGVGVGSEFGKFSGSVSHSSDTGSSYGIGWKAAW
ncbi:hypothetical protein V2P20_05905 [Methylobacter sp. Wu1]|uniref:hypothetical protein n=1 Tax=Methylobacter sp. Wu1 TaxID=3119359 RepID=UPI002F934600